MDYVIFLADMTHDYYSILKNDFTLLNIGLKKIIKYVQKKNIKFILGSSSWIYDKTNKKVLKEEIIKIDKKAFITILDSYEVYGGTNRYNLPLHDLRI